MLKYGFEFPPEEKIRAAFIGCGGHSFRNVYPALRYAPIDLIAVCDVQEERAKAYAREFGALRAYADHEAMFGAEELDAVFIVTNYDAEWKPRFPQLAIAAMQAGAHAWIEKPPASSSDEIREMMRVEAATGKFTQVGYKKMFFPAIEKLCAIRDGETFGKLTSLSVRYHQHLPEFSQRNDARAMLGFLDHLPHPASILQFLAGAPKSLYYERASNGASVSVLTYASGAVAQMHLTAGQSGTSPLERVEIIGEGENAVAENGVKVTYYRRGGRGPGGYGRSPLFYGDDAHAPIVWEPEFSLGQLYNKGLFLLGYASEVIAFAESVQTNRPPEKAHLRDALDIVRLYEAYRDFPERTPIAFD